MPPGYPGGIFFARETILEVAPVADTNKGREYPAAAELGAPDANTLDGALGPNFEAWAKHVQAHTPLTDAGDGTVTPPDNPVVPILEYGDGPNDYISTDIDAGQAVVRDGNDKTGRAWKVPLQSFFRFVAKAQGKKLAGDDEEEAKGDSMYEAARKMHERTGALIDGERKAADGAARRGESSTATSNRAAADTQRTAKQ